MKTFFKKRSFNRFSLIIGIANLNKLFCVIYIIILSSPHFAQARKSLEKNVQSAHTALIEADTLFSQNRLDKAVETYDLALQYLNIRLTDPLKTGHFVNWQNVSEPELGGEILQHKANTQFQIVLERRSPQGRPLIGILTQAFNSAVSSKTLLEAARLKLGIGDEKAKFRVAKKLRDSYDLIIDIIYLRSKGIENESAFYAFSISQRSRGRALLDLLWAKQQIRFFPRDQHVKLRALLSQIALEGSLKRSLEEELGDNSPQSDNVRQLNNRLKATDIHLHQIESDIKHIDPSFSRNKLMIPFPEEGGYSFRSQLEPGDIVIQFHLNAYRVYAFIIPEFGDIKIVQLRIPTYELTAKVENYVQRLKRHLSAWKQAASELYMDLMVDLLPFLNKPKRVFIVPSGILYTLPFQTLIDPMTDKYIVQQFYVSYLPHTELLGVAGSYGEIQRPKRAMVIGINHFKTKGMNDLKFSEDEAKKVVKALGSHADLFLDSKNEATKQNLVPLFSNYDIIHISSQAIFDRRPMNSRILFKNEKGNDVGMSAFDFLDLEKELKPGLITLSACETAKGRLDRADDILGLPRALFFAGVRVVVASLWKVEERSTELLMSQFYRELAKPDISVDQALQQAQEWLRSKYARFNHPYYWGGFIVIGDGRMVFTHQSIPTIKRNR